MEEEIWKDIKGYEGKYKVSSLGNVKSLSRTVKCGYNKTRTIRERILKPGLNTTGYYIVVLSEKSTLKTRKVHQLVAIAFLNHIPNGFELVVNHINFNRLDNRLINLEIVTQRENANQKHLKEGRTSKYTGVNWYKSLKKWRAGIEISGKIKYLGVYKNEIDAHNAYQKALNELTQKT